MFMLHGLADELVEATHSTRLCGALSGDLDAVAEREFWLAQGDEEIVIDCDSRGSELHMIRQGDHALDVCLSGNILLRDFCLSGSEQSRNLVADTVNEASEWAASVADVRATERAALLALDASDDSSASADITDIVTDEITDETQSGGSGAIFALLLPLLLPLLLQRKLLPLRRRCQLSLSVTL